MSRIQRLRELTPKQAERRLRRLLGVLIKLVFDLHKHLVLEDLE